MYGKKQKKKIENRKIGAHEKNEIIHSSKH